MSETVCMIETEVASKRPPIFRRKTSWHLKGPLTFNDVWSDPIDALVRFVSSYDLGEPELYQPKGEGWRRGPVPTHPMWRENLYILRWASMPLIGQYLLLTYTDVTIPSLSFSWPLTQESKYALQVFAVQFFIYQLIFILFIKGAVARFHHYMKVYGTFNEDKRGRDMLPDSDHQGVILASIYYIFTRAFGIFGLPHDRTGLPSVSLWTPVKMSLFLIVLDYFFYVYHRATHEIDALWFIHRKHHATKAPTPSLAPWADEWQDAIEWAIIPFLSYQVVPLSFAESYLAASYLMYVEVVGHSGIRLYYPHALMGWFLRPFDMDLTIEDHDLHHRYGRGGKNFGKQTRIWDKIFGTVGPREENRRYEEKWLRQHQH